MGRGLGVPIFLPWQGGLVVILAGAALIALGARQQQLGPDPNRIPLTSWVSKYFFGGVLVVVGAVQLLPALLR